MDQNDIFRQKVKRVSMALTLLLGLSFYSNPISAAAKSENATLDKKSIETDAAKVDNSADPKNRMEISTSYESLSPKATYGDWKTVSVALYHKARPDMTWFAQASNFSRQEGTGQMATIGAYKDWSDTLYTYTSLTSGTNTDYLPRIRADHDFNFKFGAEKQYVWTVGGSYIKYHDEHKDRILSTGLTAPIGSCIAEYRIFRNSSDPGSVTSYSHLISLMYGEEKKQWTTLTYSAGKQAYLAIPLRTAEEVTQDSKAIDLEHRRWLGANHGYFIDISYLNLTDGYHKTGFSVGLFTEY